jgi:hypothetical protein
MAIWNILLGFVKFYGHLEHFVIILYSFPTFGIMYLEKSGNPVSWPSNASDAAVEINNLENEIRRIDCLPPNVSMGEMHRVTRWVCEKNRPKCGPTHFLPKSMHELNRGIK